jgi:very-short-patch-repair endonuclease
MTIIKREQRLKERAKELRLNMTNSEKRLWYDVLKKDRLLGLRFVRQRILGQFIVDFYCAKLKLAIEVDGEIHENNLEYDKERDYVLNKMGIILLRIKNKEIMNNIYTVKNKIEKICSELMR